MVTSGGAGRVAALMMACCTTVGLAGCSTTTPGAPQVSSEAPPVEVDLAGLADIVGDFPPGYSASAGTVHQEEAAYVDLVGTTVSWGKELSVDPPQCRPLLKPVDGVVGADYIGVRADSPGTREQGIFVGANAPVTVPTDIPATGCERMSFEVADGPPGGTALRLPVSEIPGATTFAYEVRFEPFLQSDYHYVAILADRTYVHVDARVPPNFEPQPLDGLLVKAVAAVR